MRFIAAKRVAIALFLSVSSSQVALANSVNQRALDLVGQQKFEQALNTLSTQSVDLKSGYDHRFLKARILSWAGKYPAARQELRSLMASYPGNADLELALGNLEYYQGNFDAAEIQYQTLLAKVPDYQDARTGLENVRKARAAARANGQSTWRIDGALGYSDFNEDDRDEWNDQFLRVAYTPDTLTYHGSVQRFQRFGETDIQVQAGLSDAVRGGWDWGVEAGFTPNADFRPDFSLGANLGRAVETQSGIVFYPKVNYRYDDYASGAIHSVQPGVVTYLDGGVVLTGRLIATLQDGESDQLGWLFEGRAPVTDRLQARAGYANAPEAIDGVAITTKSLFGGLSYDVRDDLQAHLNLARDDRENSFVRTSANVGFTYKR